MIKKLTRMLSFKLNADISKFKNSEFFKTIQQDVVDKEPQVIEGKIDIFGYIFSPEYIDFENILEYWNVGTYFDLKINTLLQEIKNHIDLSMDRSPSAFEQIIQIHQRSYNKFQILPLFKNTTDILEIYKHMKETKDQQHLLFIYHEMFVSVLKTTNPIFEVFDIIKNKTLHKINDFKHKCFQNKDKFMDKFNSLTCGLIDDTFDWKNVVCAGGMVLESISVNLLNQYTDVDLFLYGTREEQSAKAKQLCEYFQNKGFTVWFGQEQSVITICFESIERTVQIISTKYLDPSQIVINFDIYCNSVLYDGIDVYATKKWILGISTSITEHNNHHFVKNKRVYKTIMKGFTFDKNYDNTTLYLEYVKSGEAEKEFRSHYYPNPNKEKNENIEKMCDCYKRKSFTQNIQELDFESFADSLTGTYFESSDADLRPENIVMVDPALPNANHLVKIISQVNDEQKNISFLINYYQCQLFHEKNCTGCCKSFDNLGNPTNFHDFYNGKSFIEVNDEFNEKYNQLLGMIQPIIKKRGKHLLFPCDKKHIKMSDNVIIVLNGEKTTLDKIHSIYKNGFDDPLKAPFARIKCTINNYCVGSISVSCVYAEFVYNHM